MPLFEHMFKHLSKFVCPDDSVHPRHHEYNSMNASHYSCNCDNYKSNIKSRYGFCSVRVSTLSSHAEIRIV